MCELIAARAHEPFRMLELWPLAERLERFGIAGFGWGAAWQRPDGSLDSYRDMRAFRDDPAGRQRVGEIETASAIVHLRRPSRLSTLTLADTQPFLDPAGRFALAHNGDLRHHDRWRTRYRTEGRISGRADSEVAARWLEDEWAHGDATVLLPALHDAFGGQANLAVLQAGGSLQVYAGNVENPVFAYRLSGLDVVSTGIHSIDRSLFRFVAPGATERRMVGFRAVCSLSGSAVEPSAGGR